MLNTSTTATITTSTNNNNNISQYVKFHKNIGNQKKEIKVVIHATIPNKQFEDSWGLILSETLNTFDLHTHRESPRKKTQTQIRKQKRKTNIECQHLSICISDNYIGEYNAKKNIKHKSQFEIVFLFII